MDKRLEEYFVKTYPKLFRDYGGDARTTCMAWGCSCGNGWFYLMDEAFKVAEHPGVILLQVKEKLGGLRLYWMGPGPPDFPALTEDEGSKIRTALDTAEERSYEVCENCGAPGKTNREGWIYTHCKRCEELNHGARNYEADVRDELRDIGDATGDKIARKLGLRTKCATYKDHQPNHKYTHCLICKQALRYVAPAVKAEEDKLTAFNCPQDNYDGEIAEVDGWICGDCGLKVSVHQPVVEDD